MIALSVEQPEDLLFCGGVEVGQVHGLIMAQFDELGGGHSGHKDVLL